MWVIVEQSSLFFFFFSLGSSFQCIPAISNLALISKAFPLGIYYLFNLLTTRVKPELPNPFFSNTCSEKQNVEPWGSFISGFQPAWAMSCWLDVASPFPAAPKMSNPEQGKVMAHCWAVSSKYPLPPLLFPFPHQPWVRRFWPAPVAQASG